MKQGKVKFFDEKKGFGFIKEDGTDAEFFVHVSETVDQITKDDIVKFDTRESKKGVNAVNVQLI